MPPKGKQPIVSITPDVMPLPVCPIIPQDYDICIETMKKLKVDMPRYEAMKFNKKSTWRVAIMPFTVTIVFLGGTVFTFKFSPGFLTDFASIPHFVRGYIDNDDPRLIMGAIIHDFLFQSRWLDQHFNNKSGFKMANLIFFWCCRWYGLGRFKSNAVFDAVQGAIGEKVYMTDEERDKIVRGTLKIDNIENLPMEVSRYAKI